MSSISEQLAKKRADEKASAHEQYIRIVEQVASANEVDNNHVDALHNLSAQLGKTPDDVEGDIDIVKRIKAIEPLVAAESQNKIEADKLAERVRNRRAEIEKEINALNAEVSALAHEMSVAFEKWRLSSLSAIEIVNLRKRLAAPVAKMSLRNQLSEVNRR